MLNVKPFKKISENLLFRVRDGYGWNDFKILDL